MEIPTNVSTLYFPKPKLTDYTHGDNDVEFIFSDERFGRLIGDTKIIDQSKYDKLLLDEVLVIVLKGSFEF